MIVAIDPGTTESAYISWHEGQIGHKGKVDNKELRYLLKSSGSLIDTVVIEQIKGYSPAPMRTKTGKMRCPAIADSVFDTVYWSGIFAEAVGLEKVIRIPRKTVVGYLCGKGGDSKVIEALVNRHYTKEELEVFGKYGKGTKKNPGFFYGFAADVWQAYALLVYYTDKVGE